MQLRENQINGSTQLIVLIGNPVSHSMSPLMHNVAFKQLGLNYCYLCCQVFENQVEAAVNGLRALNIKGANVTVPHKQAVIPFLDEVDETANIIGSVNTIINKNGKLSGTNTDWIGATDSLEEHIPIHGKTIIVVGAGGSSRAIIYGIKKRGGKVIVLNRTLSKAEELGKLFQCDFGTLADIDNIQGDILINTTSVGMTPNHQQSIVTEKQLAKFQCVFDIVYNPLETQLLKLGKKLNLKVVPGLKMLIYQGAGAFKLWTGQQPDTELMYQTALNYLQKEQ